MSVHLLPRQSPPNPILHTYTSHPTRLPTTLRTIHSIRRAKPVSWRRRTTAVVVAASSSSAMAGGELELTEENVRIVLEEAREELGQLFDASVGITGVAELADLDGPFVKIRLKGRFWHKRSTVLARLSNFLRQRIPEVLEVEIEDEQQLDDSPANF